MNNKSPLDRRRKKSLVNTVTRWAIMWYSKNKIDGITCLKPEGAFYVFPNITGTGLTSDEFADLALYEAGVAALAGTAFGINEMAKNAAVITEIFGISSLLVFFNENAVFVFL